jgi:hypothetical protein
MANAWVSPPFYLCLPELSRPILKRPHNAAWSVKKEGGWRRGESQRAAYLLHARKETRIAITIHNHPILFMHLKQEVLARSRFFFCAWGEVSSAQLSSAEMEGGDGWMIPLPHALQLGDAHWKMLKVHGRSTGTGESVSFPQAGSPSLSHAGT